MCEATHVMTFRRLLHDCCIQLCILALDSVGFSSCCWRVLSVYDCYISHTVHTGTI